MTTPDLATIVDEQEAEIGRLVAELAVVHRDWQADVGTLTARAQTAEARADALDTDRFRWIDRADELARRIRAHRDAARKVAQAYRELDAENSRWIGIVSGVLHERDAARAEAARLGIAGYVSRQMEWSRRTFGEGTRAAGLIKHITKELQEIAENPRDLIEWVDVAILAMDGAWRAGYTPEQVATALYEKQAVNFARQWPSTTTDDEPTEHIRAAALRGPAQSEYP